MASYRNSSTRLLGSVHCSFAISCRFSQVQAPPGRRFGKETHELRIVAARCHFMGPITQFKLAPSGHSRSFDESLSSSSHPGTSQRRTAWSLAVPFKTVLPTASFAQPRNPDVAVDFDAATCNIPQYIFNADHLIVHNISRLPLPGGISEVLLIGTSLTNTAMLSFAHKDPLAKWMRFMTLLANEHLLPFDKHSRFDGVLWSARYAWPELAERCMMRSMVDPVDVVHTHVSGKRVNASVHKHPARLELAAGRA